MRSAKPLSLAGALSSDPTALAAQSRCDRSGECHGSGWGIATYNGEPRVVRSTLPAYADPQYAEHANSLISTLALAHVRQASVGLPAIENTHPFVSGRWVFAHNGTLQGFAERKSRLIEAIPSDLRSHIAGATDSEHLFYFWLGRLRAVMGEVNGQISVDMLSRSLQETIAVLADWFGPCNGEVTKLNFLVTNGSLLAATRWKHSLWVLESSEPGDAAQSEQRRKILFASEPTTVNDWREVPDGSVLIVDEQLRLHSAAIKS